MSESKKKKKELEEEEFKQFLKKWDREKLLNFDAANIILKRDNFLKSNKKFKEWAIDNDIKGDGTLDYPYVIDSSIELPERVFLANLDLFVLFDSRELNLLDFMKCKNVMIKDCKFTKLTFSRCRDLKILNCEIDALNVLRSKNFKFENCTISMLFDFFSKNIEYNKCEIKSDYFKEAKKFRDQIYKHNLSSPKGNALRSILRK